MRILIQNACVVDAASALQVVGDIAIANGQIVALPTQQQAAVIPDGFVADKVIDAQGLIATAGLVDLAVRLREPGQAHVGMLQTEMAAAVAGGVTTLVCPPDTSPVLDEPGLVDMLIHKAGQLGQSRVYPLGALTKGLQGEVLTEILELTEAGCVGFSQAEVPIINTQVLLRALQYAATFNYTVWLRPQDAWLGKGVAASGALATRMGLSGISVAAELVALHTIFELVRSTQARVHLCRISSAAGVNLVRQAKAEGLPVTCDVSIHNLHLIDIDVGYFDSRTHLSPPLRQDKDRQALRQALQDGTIDALVSDHTPVDNDAKVLPFAQSEIGATAVELLLSQAVRWMQADKIDWLRTLAVLTQGPAQVLRVSLGQDMAGIGRLQQGQVADVCLFDPAAWWQVNASQLRSQSHHTPFMGHEVPAAVRYTLVAGQVVYQAKGCY